MKNQLSNLKNSVNYEFPTSLNIKDIQHVYRRMGIGASMSDLDRMAGRSQSEVVTELLEKARDAEALEVPFYKDYGWMQLETIQDPDFVEIAESRLSSWFIDAQENPFLTKLKLFWLNHFVAQYSSYEMLPMLYEYQNCLHKNALGNFKEFVREVGITGAMLVYLSGEVNEKSSPNENYARELYELFTLGEGNGYSQNDITETSRALTGYRVEGYERYQVYFDEEYFDDGSKSIFGQEGNWGYDDVIDILFEQRADEIAKFICDKIYSYFVHPDQLDDPLIDQMANTFISSGFELYPVYELMFLSDAFMSSDKRSCMVKSPIDCIATVANELGIDFNDEAYNYEDEQGKVYSINYALALYWSLGEMGQFLYDPVDVAGWKGNRNWLNTNSLIERWSVFDFIAWKLVSTNREQLMAQVKDLTMDPSDPEEVTSNLIEHIVQSGFYTNSAYQNALDIFKGDVPENYFASGRWNLDWEHAIWQVHNLLRHIGRQPEFMLF